MSSLPKDDTNREGEQNDHYQETSIADSVISESIGDLSREQIHSHCLVDNNLSQCSSHMDFNLDFDHILAEEENFENNPTSFEKQPCH